MKQIEHLNILVVGDIMVDKYTEGIVEKISNEAPVPILNVTKEYYNLGGCGNVVRNLREIGIQVDCLSSISKDNSGQIIKKLLEEINVGGSIIYGSKKTTIKQRIIANNTKTQMLRIDKEINKKIDFKDIPKNKLDIIQENKYDIIIVSDYNKGMITKELMGFLQKLKGNPKIIVDPKPINSFLYNGVYMITPNEKEWQIMQVSSTYNLKEVKYILETKGSKGMILHEKNSQHKISSTPIPVFNVSGCGDVVVAVIAACLSSGYSPLISTKIANKCAGYTATFPGTSIIPKKKFQEYFDLIINQ